MIDTDPTGDDRLVDELFRPAGFVPSPADLELLLGVKPHAGRVDLDAVSSDSPLEDLLVVVEARHGR